MLPVSQDYQQAVTADVRDFRARIEITWTDPTIDQSIQVTTNSRANISWLKHTADSREDPSFKYAALDGTWKLDGTYHLAPDTEEQANKYQMGYWSGVMSNPDGTFNAPYPRLTVRFLPRPVFGLKVVGDSARKEYPVDFEIRVYDKTHTLAHTETITGNASIYWQKSITPFDDIVRIELEIQKWSHGGRHAKIVEFFTSMAGIYEGDDIVLLSLLEERETSKGSLPIGNITANELTLRLLNENDRFYPANIYSIYHNLIKPNRKIRAWLGPVLPNGVVEYQPLGVFWTQPWDVPEMALYADTTCWDRMELLNNSTYNCGLYQNTNMYDRAAHILQDAGLAQSEYWVDPELQNHTVKWFWMKPCSHREALRKVVERCLGQAYADRKGIIRVEGPSFIKMPEIPE